MEHGLSDIVQKIGRTDLDLHFLIHGDRSLAGRRKYHTLRIGNNTTNSPNNIQGQVEKAADGEKKRMRKPPVFTNLRALQSRFASDASLSIYNLIIDNNSLFDIVMSRKNPPSAKQPAANPTDDDSPPPLKKLRHDSQGAVPITPSTEQKDQQLQGLCPNLCKLLNEDNIDPSDPRLDKLLSEIVSLKQQQRRVVHKNSNNRTCTLVNVPKTTTLNSFIKCNDWVDSALDANSPSDDPYDSIYRVVRHCGKRNRDATVNAIKDLGVPIVNPMTPTQFAGMVTDVRLTGVQEETLAQHLRHHLGKGFCPARKHLRMMCEGHSKIITGSVTHVYDPKSGEEETIQFSYKDPTLEFLTHLQRKIDSYKVDINTVKRVRYQSVFLLCQGSICQTSNYWM